MDDFVECPMCGGKNLQDHYREATPPDYDDEGTDYFCPDCGLTWSDRLNSNEVEVYRASSAEQQTDRI